MDFFFITISFVFILFLFLSYFIGIIKLSYPLVLIYLVFCFSYLMNQDSEEKVITDLIIDVDKHKHVDKDYAKNIDSKGNLKSKIYKKNDFGNEEVKEISKPVVSFNPKPIKIDSNLIIQKNKEKNKLQINNINKDKVTKTNKTNKDNSNFLKLKEIMICRGVYKRNPIKPGFKFTNNVDSLFCYTKISNSGPKQEIKHVWYYEDKLITSVVYNIKTSYNYRSWSKKNIFPSQVGTWRVDVVDGKNLILGSREFEILLLNDLFN